jgi:3-oxoacyl-[acyl-carrier protein] reductase
MAQEVAIVTGAGSGIGRAVAHRLARDGMAVVVNDVSGERAQLVAEEIGASNYLAKAIAGDVSREDDVAAIVAFARSAFGDCSVMVNNDFDRMFAVHVRGAFLCTRAVLPAMLAKERGIVINVASQLGQIGGVELVHYSAAKAAIIGMTKSLAREVSAQGVRVNAVAPGPINTPLVMALSKDWREAKAKELPLGRFGEPDEVAATVSFLASPEASLYVGQTLGPNSGDVML